MLTDPDPLPGPTNVEVDILQHFRAINGVASSEVFNPYIPTPGPVSRWFIIFRRFRFVFDSQVVTDSLQTASSI
jgi:hypothetical protein